MLGFIFCVIAGAAMSVQGVWNTRLGEHIGTMEANAFVQATAAALSAAALLFYRTGSFQALGGAPWYCMLGGALGLVITLTVMLGIGALSPTVAIIAILISQMLVAPLIDAFVLFGAERVSFGWQNFLALSRRSAGLRVFTRKGL